MSLAADMDLAGQYITESAFSIIDGLARGREDADFTLTNAYIAPQKRGLTLKPDQLRTDWPSAAGKLEITDFLLETAKWEQITPRAATDYALHSKGLASAQPVVSKKSFSANIGFFLEFFAYAVPNTVVSDLVILTLGTQFKIHIHSSGLADLEDLRPGALQKYLFQNYPLTAGGQSMTGKDVNLLILPWRRGRLLFTTNQGAAFETNVGYRLDTSSTLASKCSPGEPGYYVTTEAGQVTLMFSTSVKAKGAINPLTYPIAGGTAVAKTVDLPRDVPNGPDRQSVQGEQQDGTTIALALANGDGTPFAPTELDRATDCRFTLTLTTPDIYHAPVVFGVNIDWDRGLGDRAYQTNHLANILDMSFTFARDRDEKSFEIVLDNPGDAWTSLKDLYNKDFRAFLTADGVVDKVATTLFVGRTDEPEFVDGVKGQIRIPVSGLRKMLKTSLMDEDKAFDGYTHSNAVVRCLLDGGVDRAKIITIDDGIRLEKADHGDDPLWRPTNGQSRDEWIQHIADTFSGWVFDDIGGLYYYVPRSYFTALALAGNPAVTVVRQSTPLDAITHQPTNDGPNPSVLVALDGSVTQSSREPRANDIWVLGRDPDGNILAAHYVDDASIENLSERRILVYASASITSQFMAAKTCAVLAGRLTQAQVAVAFALPDYQWQKLPLEGPVQVENYPVGLVTSVSVKGDLDRYRESSYTYEVLS